MLVMGIKILSLGIDNQRHRWKEQSQLKQWIEYEWTRTKQFTKSC